MPTQRRSSRNPDICSDCECVKVYPSATFTASSSKHYPPHARKAESWRSRSEAAAPQQRERERDVIEFLAVYFFSVAIDEFGLCYSALLFALHFERGKHERMEDKKPSFRFHSLHELAKTFE